MPFNIGKEVAPWLFHGGEIDLTTLSKQVLSVSVTFPEARTPVTVNLAREIGFSSQARPYLVNWGDNTSEEKLNDTVDIGLSPWFHEHTFKLSDTDPITKTYTVTVYGDKLIKFYSNDHSSGSGSNSFRVVSEEVSLDVKNISR